MCKGEGQEMQATLSFQPLADGAFEGTTAVCLGTGRFLRAVLVPALRQLGGEVVLAQTRGSSFGEYMAVRGKDGQRSYELDTVLQDGTVETDEVKIAASGSLGSSVGRTAFMQLASQLPNLRFIGLGLTEAGITHNGQSILDLAEFLHACFASGLGEKSPLSMINTDNMPFNGDAIKKHVFGCDFTQQVANSQAFRDWMEARVVFHNTMVDRITSHRAGNPDVPRAEPLPAKALVVEDLAKVLPEELAGCAGVAVRTSPKQLEADIALKLRIANGLHTAMVYAMALGHHFQTDACIGHPTILPYLEQLYRRDIVHVCSDLDIRPEKAEPVFKEWMDRLQHPHFGLGCLFVCQNAMQKMGIRLWPSVLASIKADRDPSAFMAFACAAILRFLTPFGEQPRSEEVPPTFVGQLCPVGDTSADDFEYTTGLFARPKAGAYDFRDGSGATPRQLMPLAADADASTVESTVKAVFASSLDGFDSTSAAQGRFAGAVASLLRRMLSGEPPLTVLADLLAGAA